MCVQTNSESSTSLSPRFVDTALSAHRVSHLAQNHSASLTEEWILFLSITFSSSQTHIINAFC